MTGKAVFKSVDDGLRILVVHDSLLNIGIPFAVCVGDIEHIKGHIR
jgi:hypothetical protein